MYYAKNPGKLSAEQAGALAGNALLSWAPGSRLLRRSSLLSIEAGMGTRLLARDAAEAFGPRRDRLAEQSTPGLRMYAVPEGPVLPRITDMVTQPGSTTYLRFPRTGGLGSHATMAEMRASGALPGEQGVIVTDRKIRFGDVYELGTLGGRKIEFSLVTERVDGQLVKKLYSGDAWTSPVPRDARLIGHVHPNEKAFQLWPSTQDVNMVNARYFRDLIANPNAAPLPTRIFWGP